MISEAELKEIEARAQLRPPLSDVRGSYSAAVGVDSLRLVAEVRQLQELLRRGKGFADTRFSAENEWVEDVQAALAEPSGEGGKG